MLQLIIKNINSAETDKLYEKLSQERKNKADQFKVQSARDLSVAAGSLLNPNREIVYKKNGKPYYKDYPDEKFNLSHSGKRAICIISDNEVGCDVELIKGESALESNLKIAKRFFSQDELEFINESDDKQKTFYSIWTRKESYLKTTGTGLSESLNEFSVIKGIPGYVIKNVYVEPDYMYAYCIKSEEDEEIQIHRRA